MDEGEREWDNKGDETVGKSTPQYRLQIQMHS
jgi:hypothetical protein